MMQEHRCHVEAPILDLSERPGPARRPSPWRRERPSTVNRRSEVSVVEVWIWVLFALAVGVLMLVDLLVAGRSGGLPSLRSAAAWSVLWTAVALAFTAIIAAWKGGELAGEYLAGYVVERSLSLDNLFVFALIFAYFAVPGEAQRRGLFFGVARAVVVGGGV